MVQKLKAKLASLVSAAIFLGILYALFKRLHIVVWVATSWWALILALIVLFLFIDTMVSRTFGTKEPLERNKEKAIEASKVATETAKERLEKIKSKLNDD